MEDLTLQRTALLYSSVAVQKFQQAHILLAGLGGVGLYALESLVRAGISAFTLVDDDVFEASNLNRQLYALPTNLGQAKVVVAAARVQLINPRAQVTPRQEKITADLPTTWLPNDCSFVIDAIDDIAAKAALARLCLARQVPLIICLGTARRMDPTQISYTTLGKTQGCPLARALRQHLRDVPAAAQLPVVISRETPCAVREGSPLPSGSTVPAAAGLALSAYVLQTLSLSSSSPHQG